MYITKNNFFVLSQKIDYTFDKDNPRGKSVEACVIGGLFSSKTTTLNRIGHLQNNYFNVLGDQDI